MEKTLMPGVTIAPRRIDTAAGEVEFDLTEGDGPLVLASHGGIGGFDQARLILNWLDPGSYRLLSPSRPGYLGTPLSSGQSTEAQADLFAALLDALGLERAAVVMLSSGGPAGYLFAARHPHRVSALVAISSVSGRYNPPETAGAATQAIFMSGPGQKLVNAIAHRKPGWLVQETLRSTGYYDKRQLKAHVNRVLRSPQAMDFVRALFATMNPYKPRMEGTNNDLAAFRRLTHLPLGQVRCPSLIVHGTHDADVKFHHGVHAFEHIQGAERFWIEEGSHLGFWLGPHGAEAQGVAREFLRRHRL
jgi:pimeloyl-ACP methyl ester carboxylesterase